MTKITPEPYYRCDCCDARIKERYAVRHLNLDMISYSIVWDLCESCANYIDGHVKALKETRRYGNNH